MILDFVINWTAWGVAAIYKTEKFYDLTGSISFITVGLFSLTNAGHYHARQIGVTMMVLLWTVRLGSFLFLRTMITGGDSRFEEAKTKPGLFFVYWTVQAVWVWVCSLPLILENASVRNPGVNWSDVIGIMLYTTGFLVEAVADLQKFFFKKNPENKGRFVDVGLWKYARYPQYFGEILLWWGIFATAAAGLHGWEFVAIISPLFVMLLTLYVSGIPIQEKQAKERWGDSQEYMDYRRKTNFLVPLPKIWKLKL